MIVQMIEKDAWNQIEDPNLRWLFQLTDKIDILEREYGVVGRPGVPRPVMLRCFLLKAYFGIPSLRQLVQFLHHHLSWCQTIGLVYVPHLSAFSRAGAWWQEEGMRMLHNGLLRQLSLNTDVVFFDSTVLRSSLYDKQARWGKSTRYDNYKGYKLHTVTNRSGMVLAYQVTTANVYDGDPVPSLFKQLRRYSIQFVLGDAIYDAQEVQRQAQKCEVIFIAPLNPRNHLTRHNTFPRVIHQVLQTKWGQELYKLRTGIERVFASLKEKRRIEQPRWYGYKHYLFHCQLCIFIHNALCLF